MTALTPPTPGEVDPEAEPIARLKKLNRQLDEEQEETESRRRELLRLEFERRRGVLRLESTRNRLALWREYATLAPLAIEYALVGVLLYAVIVGGSNAPSGYTIAHILAKLNDNWKGSLVLAGLLFFRPLQELISSTTARMFVPRYGA